MLLGELLAARGDVVTTPAKSQDGALASSGAWKYAAAEAVADEADPHLFRSHGPIVGRSAGLRPADASDGCGGSIHAW